MNDITQIFGEIEQGNAQAAERLLPLVYDELRRLAAQKMRHERPGHTLDPTALVHEAYLRLVGTGTPPSWNGRGHFFAAAAEAMRRILIERARRKHRLRHGGDRVRLSLEDGDTPQFSLPEEMLALDEALDRLETHDPDAVQVVKLRYFAGLTMPQVADALGISVRTAERNWTYARTWLHRQLRVGG